MSETEDYETKRLATFKRLKRGDDNESERILRLEKVVPSKQLRLAVRTEEERRARPESVQLPNGSGWPWRWTKKEKTRLEKMVATKRLRMAMEMDEERKARLEKMVHTAHFGPGDRGRKKS